MKLHCFQPASRQGRRTCRLIWEQNLCFADWRHWISSSFYLISLVYLMPDPESHATFQHIPFFPLRFRYWVCKEIIFFRPHILTALLSFLFMYQFTVSRVQIRINHTTPQTNQHPSYRNTVIPPAKKFKATSWVSKIMLTVCWYQHQCFPHRGGTVAAGNYYELTAASNSS